MSLSRIPGYLLIYCRVVSFEVFLYAFVAILPHLVAEYKEYYRKYQAKGRGYICYEQYSVVYAVHEASGFSTVAVTSTPSES